LIPLEEELAFLQAYLEIETVRFGERLSVSWNVDPGVRTALVPSFLLQPLVENAIRHGLAPRRVDGLLEITAHAADGNLHLRVQDNGAGLHTVSKTTGMGVGLANTRERLEKLYGQTHTFNIVPRRQGGVSVLLVLPLRFNYPEKAGVLAHET
jgi:sensor histidine kinase YesM